MAKANEPVMLELAHLPREQVGPFLMLGLDKDAHKEDIEAHWAERLKWARKGTLSITLEEINWARETINDHQRRAANDVTSLNVDTGECTLAQLSRRLGVEGGKPTVGWDVFDEEKQLANYQPAVEVPDRAEIQATVHAPEIPREFPAAARLLSQLVQSSLDPWQLRL